MSSSRRSLLAVGAAWQALISPQLTYGLPNPPQGALIVMMLCSPLLHKMLTPTHKPCGLTISVGSPFLPFH